MHDNMHTEIILEHAKPFHCKSMQDPSFDRAHLFFADKTRKIRALSFPADSFIPKIQ